MQTGDLFGTVTDAQGQEFPGVTVTLTGQGEPPRAQITDAQGRFNFPGLDPGTYQVQAQLVGFTTVKASAGVHAGRHTALTIAIQPAISE